MYTMAHTYKDYKFLPRIVHSHFSYLASEISSGRLVLDGEGGGGGGGGRGVVRAKL